MNNIKDVLPNMDKPLVFRMPNVILIGKAKRNSQLINGAGAFWGELYGDGTLEKLSKLPRIISNHFIGWSGDCCEDETVAGRDFTYMVGAFVPYDSVIPDGFEYRVLRSTIVIKGILGESMEETIASAKAMGYTTNYGDNNGWNAELYLDGEPDESKWSWLIPIKKT